LIPQVYAISLAEVCCTLVNKLDKSIAEARGYIFRTEGLDKISKLSDNVSVLCAIGARDNAPHPVPVQSGEFQPAIVFKVHEGVVQGRIAVGCHLAPRGMGSCGRTALAGKNIGILHLDGSNYEAFYREFFAVLAVW
jgi:hypothetical protein